MCVCVSVSVYGSERVSECVCVSVRVYGSERVSE